MLYKIVTYFFLPCMVLALLLSFVGVQKVEFGSQYMDFLRGVSIRLDSWSFAIPSIPSIKQISSEGGGLIQAINVIVSILNGFVTVINVLITIVNVVISLIQFILTLIYCVIDFRDTMALTSVEIVFSSIIG